MSRMIDLIRQSGVPANLMRTAARGALSLPPGETLEILVFLAQHAIFGQQAQLTLAEWDEKLTLAVVSDPQAPAEVLDYFTMPANLRPGLLPALLENPSVPESRLMELAREVSPNLLPAMAASPRVCSCVHVIQLLLLRSELDEERRMRLGTELRYLEALNRDMPGGDILEPDLTDYLAAHAGEIAAEEGKPFHLVDSTLEEQAEIAAGMASRQDKSSSVSAVAARALGQAASAEAEHTAPVQKIAKMSVGERVQLAYRGTRDERFILIRDGARVVSAAVLDSPKLTESEVEAFASMRNVSEHVPRIIASKRKWMRKYALKRLLTVNPRCPMEVAVPLIKELLLVDLKNLTMNRDVSDMVRHVASKVWNDKSSTRR
jgi:hypothetical protein